MASPLRNVTNIVKDAALAVVDKVKSTTIPVSSTNGDGAVENSSVAVRDMASSTMTDNSSVNEQSESVAVSVLDQKVGDPDEEVEYNDNMANEKQFEGPDIGGDNTAAEEQQIHEDEAAWTSQLHKPASNNVLPGLDFDTPHPDTAEIVRQTEYYFSDDNLAQDAHLLARTGPTGDGWVSINEIMGFKKMRKYRPRSKVKTAIATSEVLELDGKFIRRKAPLNVAPRVQPKADPKRERDRLLQEKPWLTKGMLQPTGFEEYATEGPLPPAQFDEERRLFDPEEAFTTRIEYAATRFADRKKMHQASANIFTKFMLFGGFAPNTHMFAGSMDKKELEEYDKEQVLQMTAKMGVSDSVIDGLNSDSIDAGSWTVDFEGMAKAFLSSEFLQHFEWHDVKVVRDTTNVLRKFYEYLLYHDACPEYEDDIRDAIDVCDLANVELPKLAKLALELPGNFNMATSILQSGFYARVRPSDTTAEWVFSEDHLGLSDVDAQLIFSAGLMAHASDDQIDAVCKAQAGGTSLQVTTEEDIGLEIVRVEKTSEAAAKIYDDDRIKGTLIKPTGKLYCKRWYHPGAAPRDVPSEVKANAKTIRGKQYEFILEADVLEHCEPGMKLEANVSQLKDGLMWLDLVENVYPTFFKWTLNERVRDWKEPGPPKSWMQRASAKEVGEEVQDVAGHEDEHETPD
ncbi:Putative argonaute-binding protein [Septoria linicola]|uniref:Argonaute-binding protein n=1 Tax=Septoria linicola TaxID=215465 RepID=A0A9Q9AXZ9_9PEZI|nr:Putative argonaute-binding protein [Septoria linicola]